MGREQKIQQAFRLVEAIVGGYASQGNKAPTGLIKSAWVELFKNCYEGVNAMLEKVDEIDPSAEPDIKVL
jgi:hypothetical protein